MAISYIGASAALVAATSATTTTFASAFTAATSGSDRKLVVVFATKEDTPSITSVSYNGQALTQATSATQSGSVPDTQIYIYYLDHASIPTDGAAHDLVIVSSDSMNPIAIVLEYAGVAQGAPSQTDTDIPTGGAAGTCSFTSVVDGSLIVAGLANAAVAIGVAPGGGLTEILEIDQNVSSPQYSCVASHIVGTSGATINATEDPTGTGDSAMCAALWTAASAASATSLPPPLRNPSMMSLLVR